MISGILTQKINHLPFSTSEIPNVKNASKKQYKDYPVGPRGPDPGG
jgi:hypothetical protein